MNKKAISLLLILPFLLAGCKTMTFKKPSWKDGEKATYILKENGEKIGTAVFLIEKKQFEDKDIYVFSNRGLIPGRLNSYAVSQIKSNLKPISTTVYIANEQGQFNFTADYSKHETVNITYNTPMGERKKSLKIPLDSYDFGEVLYLLRNLPIVVGKKAEFTEVWPSFGQKFEVTAKVVSMEKIKVPAGRYKTFKVEYNFGKTMYKSWYSVEKPHYLILHDNGKMIYELKKVEIVNRKNRII
ncbi:MAG: DUF3108 domain-containing protein [Actinobacteria bacterium]|nr:DUF3108 domain-containing protein [Actinomycetota bacterium]